MEYVYRIIISGFKKHENIHEYYWTLLYLHHAKLITYYNAIEQHTLSYKIRKQNTYSSIDIQLMISFSYDIKYY